ncbi:uncharacterized protein HMPREF1541_01029 [Cyphellophora europaea CBS 101466]|uniref:Uncharacterized protein n=1 Tax=Cyphellophora europaea (strain CBS 101466) TaxID=1220924 RepID=W2SDY5_CYPE1|nr:uncharacterized protein HMPREF1541_01029 [Cyphellophora europaea CBS 101466]ETN46840.1 hypothetical protein HMPREF1541_01029 [Cyphellophora europaea CBS 101466]
MDKLKQTFSRNKETEAEDTSSRPTAGGKVTGQGTHFPSSQTMDTGDNLGSTVGGQQDPGIGGTRSDPQAALSSTGPETSGGGHISTANPSGTSQGATAIGQTSTYSTHHLSKGDPTPSVVDPQSSDPTSFKKPEASTGAGTGAGVPPNAAQVAASKAFTGSSHKEGMPGAYPTEGYENPYKAESLDPRVDNLPIRSKQDQSSGRPTAAAGSALGTGAGAGAGVAAATSGRSTGPDTSRTTAAPSSLTSTVNPGDRSAEYGTSEQTRVPEAGTTATQEQSPESSGFMGKALAAVGLGGAAGAAGYGVASRHDKDSAVADSTLSTDSTPQPTHGRKESIPTTAYPGGLESPRAINPPVGGTAQGTEAPAAERESHTGRNTALGAAAVAGAGAAGYGASHIGDRDKDRVAPDAAAHTATTLGQDQTGKLRDDSASQPAGISSDTRQTPTLASTQARSSQPLTRQPDQREDHSKRNAALAAGGVGAGVGAAGASTLGQDNTSKLRDDLASQPSGITSEAKQAAPMGVTQTTTGQSTSNFGQDNTSKLRDDLASQPSGITSEAKQAAPLGATQTSSNQPRTGQPDQREDHSKRNAALAAGGAGAGVGAAGAYAATRDNKSQEPFGHTAIYGPGSGSTTTQPRAISSQTTGVTSTQPTTTRQEDIPAKREDDHTARNAALAGATGVGAAGAGAYGAHEYNNRQATQQQTTPSQTTGITGATSTQPTKTRQEEVPGKREDDHTARNTALAGAAGVGAAGAGAYGAHEYNKRAAEEESARQAANAENQRKAAEKARAEQQKAHEKALAEQEKAHKKEVEKQQKEAEKHAKKEEKEHQKEVEKQQKEAEKHAKKEEKEHQKEVAAMEKQRTKEQEELRRRQEEEEEERRKKAAAAGAVGAGAAGAGAYAYGKDKDDDATRTSTKSEEKEKKPGLFKRIFKRRKNKDTGESEEYSSDEDESHKGAAVAGAGGAAALGAGAAYGAHEHGANKAATTEHSTDPNSIGRAVSTDEARQSPSTSRYGDASGGAEKPSYNPFSKDDPSKQPLSGDHSEDRSTAPAAAGLAYGASEQPLSSDRHQGRPTEHTTSATGATGLSDGTYRDASTLRYGGEQDTGALGTQSHEDHKDKLPIERTTGMPFDPSKDPAAASRLNEQGDVVSPEQRRRTSSEEFEASSPSSEKRGIRQKLKEAITGHKHEDTTEHQAEHGVLHKKPHQVPEGASAERSP